ncbi:hypothetical protein G6011_09255 [Alternaria panax]|uniref:2EXR domain-containing protein n=1 Tax=Alternaria panax TaxID=48097 RepID=A0AAD4NNX5_9PLEO|nr:hypothetical protein G6011_09255 [Alternaria panax]
MASSRMPDNSFQFMDLPKELRIMVYERLPRTIDNRIVKLSYENWPLDQERYVSFFTLIHPSTNTSILRVCKEIHAEAAHYVQKSIRDFILKASPKVAGTLHPEYLADVLGPIIRAAARDFDHLRKRFGFSQDGKPTIHVPSLEEIIRGSCLHLAIWYDNYDEVNGVRQQITSGSLIDYGSERNMRLFLTHLAEARETKAIWDMEDLPQEALNGPALFLPGSVKARVPSIPLNSVDERSKRSIRKFVTTASIQLLYQHIERISQPALGNPRLDFVHCLPEHKSMISRASKYGACSTRRMLRAFQVDGHRSICYDYGVHIKLGGYTVVDESQPPLLKEDAIIKLPVQGCYSTPGAWERLYEPVDGVGSVAICHEPMTKEEWAEWLPNEPVETVDFYNRGCYIAEPYALDTVRRLSHCPVLMSP